MWPNNDLTNLLDLRLPIIQAPMAGASGVDMAISVSQAGGLGSLPCAMLSPEDADTQMQTVRQATARPFNANFFCHEMPAQDSTRDEQWLQTLAGYYDELGEQPKASGGGAGRMPFNDAMCEVVERNAPPVVSFHFGLPDEALLGRVKMAGCTVLCSATTVDEACWLEANGCDAIIAQGAEAGGHRGTFLTDPISSAASQPGTMALVPQVADAVTVPVIAAGGIADGRGIAAAFALGAAGVQVGTSYLHTPEAIISDLHRVALLQASAHDTALTNLFSGRPARGLMNRLMREQGPLSLSAPAFPLAGGRLAPLKRAAEAGGKTDFTSLWSGQAAGLFHSLTAADLTVRLADEARSCIASLHNG